MADAPLADTRQACAAWLLRREPAFAAAGAARPLLSSAGAPSPATRSPWSASSSSSRSILMRDLRRRARALLARSSAATCAPSACCRRATTFWLGTDDQARDIFSRIVYGSRLTLLVVVLVAIIAAPIGLAGRHHRRLSRRLGRCGADAHHRHLPRLPAPGPGARLRRGARAGHRERHHRHRHHRLAALCAHRPRRDADHPQQRLHRRRAAAGRLVAAHHPAATSCRSASPR